MKRDTLYPAKPYSLYLEELLQENEKELVAEVVIMIHFSKNIKTLPLFESVSGAKYLEIFLKKVGISE